MVKKMILKEKRCLEHEAYPPDYKIQKCKSGFLVAIVASNPGSWNPNRGYTQIKEEHLFCSEFYHGNWERSKDKLSPPFLPPVSMGFFFYPSLDSFSIFHIFFVI